MNYFVCESITDRKPISDPNDLPVKIHKETCKHYIKRKLDAKTMEWYGPFETLNKAEECAEKIGKLWKRARCVKTE